MKPPTTTPPPWEWLPESRDDEGYSVVIGPEEIKGTETIRRRLALVETGDDRGEMNARLVAAAPDLLENAVEAVRGFRQWKREKRRGGDRYRAEDGLSSLGQAIYDLERVIERIDGREARP